MKVARFLSLTWTGPFGIRELGPLIAAVASGACSVPSARFASWEPTSAQIPNVLEAPVALHRLAQSEEIWARWQSTQPDFRPWEPAPRDSVPRYTYVRALATSETGASFTVVGVADGQVVGRILFEADIADLNSTRSGSEALRTVWRESHVPSVGTHANGFVPLTVDQIYQQCKLILAKASADNPAYLYFHPNGILMQCGSLNGSERSVSIQSFSKFGLFSLHQDGHEQGHLVCVTQHGVFPPFAENPFLHQECVPPTWSPSSEETCKQRQEACRHTQLSQPARWIPIPNSCAAPAREPSFLEVGKAEPTKTWSFPFRTNESVECAEQVFLKRIEAFGLRK